MKFFLLCLSELNNQKDLQHHDIHTTTIINIYSMTYLQDFETYNESLKNIITGTMLGASLMGYPSTVSSKVPTHKGVDRKAMSELSIIDRQEYLRLIEDLEKKGYSIYSTKPKLESQKYLFATSISPRKSQALNAAMEATDDKINDLEEDKGLQIIYFIFSQNTWQFIIITELISDEDDRLYDRDTETWH